MFDPYVNIVCFTILGTMQYMVLLQGSVVNYNKMPDSDIFPWSILYSMACLIELAAVVGLWILPGSFPCSLPFHYKLVFVKDFCLCHLHSDYKLNLH
jgi:hypothetical protein